MTSTLLAALTLAFPAPLQEPAARAPAPEELVLLVPARLHADAPLQRAEAALARALAPAHALEVRGRSPAPGARTISVTLAELDELEPDGFRVDAPGPQGDLAALRARDLRGAIYGLHELARLVRLERWRPGEPLTLVRSPAFADRLCSFHDNPGEERFDSAFRDPELLLDWGFNGMIIHGVVGLVTFDDYDPRLYPEGSADRARVLADRLRVIELVRRAKANHLTVFLNGDEVCLPRRALELYGDEVGTVNPRSGERLIDIAAPRVQAMIAATFDELFSFLPEVDGIQIRTGEVYTQSEPTLAGNNPGHGSSPHSEGWTSQDKLAAVIRAVRDAVVVKHGRRYNQRMWGYYNSQHSVPERWLEVAERFEPDPRLTFSFKHPRTDYWRWNPLNPNFGVGPHAQWAEFQMAREYEGKGAFPSYLGRYLAEGPTEIEPSGGIATIHGKGVRGAWCWARGGGWRGPKLAREDWVALNVHAFVRLLWSPAEDPFELAKEWCVLERGVPPGSPALEHFAEIQRLSERALLRTRYIGPFARAGHLKGGSGWTPNGNWTRDDDLGPGGTTQAASAFYDFLARDGTVEEAVAEKESALVASAKLMEHFDALMEIVAGPEAPPEVAADWRELHSTALWGRRWTETIGHHFIGCWKAYQWRDSEHKDRRLRAAARAHVLAANEAWNDYVERVAKLPGVATPYRDMGLVAEREDVLRLLDGGE